MPFYRCLVISFSGRKGVRIFEGNDLQEIKERLLREQLAPLEIRKLRKKKEGLTFSSSEILYFTQELSRLLEAGLPLYEAIGTLEEKYKGQKLSPILISLGTSIEKGETLSEALGQFPKTFNLLYRSMIAHAEKTGRLKETLGELATLLLREQKVRKQVVSALLYPTLLFSFCLVVLSLLFFYVVPSLEKLFEERTLPSFTALVFSLSHILREGKWLVLTGFGILGFGALGARIYAPLRMAIWKRVLRVKGLRMLLAKASLSRFFRAASALLDGGVPLLAALAEARSLLRHPLLEEVVKAAEAKLIQGGKIAEAFYNHPLIPPLVPRMLSLAEQSGRLSFSFEQIAKIYEDELETALLRFTSLIQPVLLLFLGGLIGFVLLSVLMPLTDVSGF